MKYLLVLLVLVALLVAPVRALSQEDACMGGEWYTHYTTLTNGIEAMRFLPEDTTEQLADKVLTLYSIQFSLEALTRYSPECAQTLIRKTSMLAGLYADLGMLVILQMNDLGLSDEAFGALAEDYAYWIGVATQSVQTATEATSVVESAQ